MKSILVIVVKSLVAVVLAIVFLPILLGLLFLMPCEFLVSSWHLSQATATTEGVVVRSQELLGAHGGTRSDVEYGYTVNGRNYASTRLRAGLVSNHGYEARGGDFARQHPAGSRVVVYYDPDSPAFALIEYGWPKWSVGLSLAVWGLALAQRFSRAAIVRRSQSVGYALAGAIAGTGFLTLFILEPTIVPSAMLVVLAFYVAAFVALLGYANLRFRPPNEPDEAANAGAAEPGEAGCGLPAQRGFGSDCC